MMTKVFRMQNSPKDAIQFFIKIIIISFLFNCPISQCFSIESSTETDNSVTHSVTTNTPVHSHNSDYNVFKLSDIPTKTEQEDKETMIGLGKLLQKIEKEMEVRNKLKDSRINKSFFVPNYMNTFLYNMIGNNDSVHNGTDGITDGKIRMGTIPKTTESNDIISVTKRTIKHFLKGSRNKRDETIMKIPRNSNSISEIIPLVKTDMEKDDTLGVGEAAQTEEPMVERTTEPFLHDDVNTHMINWNNNSEPNPNENDMDKTNKTNDSAKEKFDYVPSILKSFLHSPSVDQKADNTDFVREWLPDIFLRIFSNFKINSKDRDSICNIESSFYRAQLKNLSLWAAKSK